MTGISIRSVFRQDWLMHSSDSHLLQWGFAFEHHKARYAYKGNADYFGLRAIFENVPSTINRDLTAAPSGLSYVLYMSDKWKVAARTILQFGFALGRSDLHRVTLRITTQPQVQYSACVEPENGIALQLGSLLPVTGNTRAADRRWRDRFFSGAAG